MPSVEATDRIRVLHLGSPTGLYGAERWILALIRYLAPEEVESVVGTIKDVPGPEPALCRQARQLGAPTCVFEAHGKLSLGAVKALAHYIRDNAIDILHTHGYKSDLLGLCAARLGGCRAVSTPHGWSVNAGLKLQAYEALDRIVLGLFDAVAPLSDELYAGLAGGWWRPRMLRLIRNGVDLSEVDEPGEVAEVMPGRQGTGGSRRIGYVGQLIPRKGVETLVRAFARLQIPGKELHVVGDGPERPTLERLANSLGEGERVRFLGYRQDRMALLKSFEAFVLPSSLEGIPRCVLESMAAGVPVVASDIPGCRSVMQHDVTGLLFPPGDVASLTGCLERLLADEELQKSLAARARALVRSEFSAQTMAAHYVQLYRELAAQSRREPEAPKESGAR